MKAILYSRWSSLEQTGTTSAPRQLALTERFAASNGWDVVERLTDEGRSAWTGDNLRTGQLGQLLARLEREGADDCVLVVEKLDRLSRQPPLVMTGWVQRACAAGLTIATADGAHLIDARRLERDQMTVLAMIFESFRGFAESQAKSERVADAWARKRERGMPMTRKCPGWLTIDAGATSYRSPANTAASYTVIPERAGLVRRIFALTNAGIGKATIARTFNQEGIPAWGSGRGWHASYIQKIVRNPAVIGEFQPHTNPKAGVRRPAGEPIADYFPAVVSVEEYERANSPRHARVLAQQSPNPLVNLLTGLTQCTSCGGPMTMTNKGAETLADGHVVPRRYLKCSSAHRSAGCAMRVSFAYEVAETAILDALLPLAMDAQHFARGPDVAGAESALLSARREQANAERLQQVAYSLVEEDSGDAFAADKYRQRRGEVTEAKLRVQRYTEELAKAQRKTSPREHVARVAEVRALMSADDPSEKYEARRLVKLALNDLIGVVQFSGKKKRFTVGLAGGVRVLSFDRQGNMALDVDWLEIDCFVPGIDHGPATEAAISAYARRKAEAATSTRP